MSSFCRGVPIVADWVGALVLYQIPVILLPRFLMCKASLAQQALQNQQ